MKPFYPSKLLLFGEYTVLSGSQALAAPLDQWSGKWEHSQHPSIQADETFLHYIDWLLSNEVINHSTAIRITKEATEGWRYVADIPIGFGLGSSGAYVAAIYDRYIYNTGDTTLYTHDILRKMEGYFHGSSSGMDPLVSLSHQALYKSEKGELHTIHNPGWPKGFETFLLDTGMARSTSTLVKAYREMLTNDDFKFKVERQLIPIVEHAIHFYLNGSGAKLEDCLEIISAFQRKYFAAFIPDNTKALWDEWLEKKGVYVKFCGAGGGGYFLVITTPAFDGVLPSHLISLQGDKKHSN